MTRKFSVPIAPLYVEWTWICERKSSGKICFFVTFINKILCYLCVLRISGKTLLASKRYKASCKTCKVDHRALFPSNRGWNAIVACLFSKWHVNITCGPSGFLAWNDTFWTAGMRPIIIRSLLLFCRFQNISEFSCIRSMLSHIEEISSLHFPNTRELIENIANVLYGWINLQTFCYTFALHYSIQRAHCRLCLAMYPGS